MSSSRLVLYLHRQESWSELYWRNKPFDQTIEVPKMAVDKNTVRELANLSGIEIADDELEEVTSRFGSLIQEMDRLKILDLSDIHPVSIFPEQAEA